MAQSERASNQQGFQHQRGSGQQRGRAHHREECPAFRAYEAQQLAHRAGRLLCKLRGQFGAEWSLGRARRTLGRLYRRLRAARPGPVQPAAHTD